MHTPPTPEEKAELVAMLETLRSRIVARDAKEIALNNFLSVNDSSGDGELVDFFGDGRKRNADEVAMPSGARPKHYSVHVGKSKTKRRKGQIKTKLRRRARDKVKRANLRRHPSAVVDARVMNGAEKRHGEWTQSMVDVLGADMALRSRINHLRYRGDIPFAHEIDVFGSGEIVLSDSIVWPSPLAVQAVRGGGK